MKNQLIPRILSYILLLVVIVLLVMSLASIIVLHCTLSKKYSFSFTPTGINNYLSAWGMYKELFIATVAVVAAYIGYYQFNAAKEANFLKVKDDRYTDLKETLHILFIEIERLDPYMKRQFIVVRRRLFNKLYDINFNLDSKEKLDDIFISIFKPLVNFFETQNNKHIGMGGSYPDYTYSYSFDSFRFLLFGTIESMYSTADQDLRKLYLSAMDGHRTVNVELHKVAVLNYKPNIN